MFLIFRHKNSHVSAGLPANFFDCFHLYTFIKRMSIKIITPYLTPGALLIAGFKAFSCPLEVLCLRPVCALPILKLYSGHKGAVHSGTSYNWYPMHSIQKCRIALMGVKLISLIVPFLSVLIFCLIAIAITIFIAAFYFNLAFC
jgi:hypothetical protein